MDNLVILNNWMEKHSNNDQENDVLLLDFSKICKLCLKESINMYEIRSHLVEFEDGSLFLEKVISNLLAEDEECAADDEFPENICFKCSEMILQFYEFKIRCKKTRDALTAYNKIITQDVVRDLDKAAGPVIHNLQVDMDQQETRTDLDEYDNCPVRSESSQDNIIKIELLHPITIEDAADERSSSVTNFPHCSEILDTSNFMFIVHLRHVACFKVIGSVCDQTGTMASAVNRLISPDLYSAKQSGMLLSYDIDGNKIIHCFDPPHVIKTLRNNLLVKNLRHSITDVYDPDVELHETQNVKMTTAKWEDIKTRNLVNHNSC